MTHLRRQVDTNLAGKNKWPLFHSRATRFCYCRILALRGVLFSWCMTHKDLPTYQEYYQFFHISVQPVFSPPFHSEMCIHLYNKGFLHCKYTVISQVLANSQITPSHSQSTEEQFFWVFFHITAEEWAFWCHCVLLSAISRTVYWWHSHKSQYGCNFSHCCASLWLQPLPQ